MLSAHTSFMGTARIVHGFPAMLRPVPPLPCVFGDEDGVVRDRCVFEVIVCPHKVNELRAARIEMIHLDHDHGGVKMRIVEGAHDFLVLALGIHEQHVY